MTDTRIQYRGTCAICGNDQAVQSNLMSLHGYTVDWNHFNYACAGSKEVHYGHSDAPALIQKTIDNLTLFLSERMPIILEQAVSDLAELRTDKTLKRIDLQPAMSRIAALQHQIEYGIPQELKRLAERKANWKPLDTYEVDVEKEAAEEKARKKAERDEKAAKKAQAEQEKAERIKQREEKAAEKARILLANQWRQIEINGEIVVEWQTAFDREGAYWRGMGDKLVEYIIEKTLAGEMSVDDYYGQGYKVFFRSRTGQGKQGKQLDRYRGLGLPIHRILEDERIKKLIDESKREK